MLQQWEIGRNFKGITYLDHIKAYSSSIKGDTLTGKACPSTEDRRNNEVL